MASFIPFNYRVIDADAIDGDTFDTSFWLRDKKDLGFQITDVGQMMRMRVRVWGIDLPEMKGGGKETESAKAAKAIADAVMTRALLQIDPVILHSHRWDKYGGRVIGDFASPKFYAGSFTEEMIRNWGARRYMGDKKEPWTEAELDKIIALAKTLA